VTVTSLEGLGQGANADPGVVLVESDQVRGGDFLDLAHGLYEASYGWRFAVVRDGQPPRVQILSLGHPEELPDVADGLARPEESPGTLMELRRILKEVSRARHDINNPLTSALAEAQLLLMDVEEEGEVREGLEVLQTQLRRIRDLVAATGHIRPPRR
jgi:signal transduction histidine kinase